jgi:hypothetical protein
MNVADWLRTLGLEQYEALFRQNNIDAEVLPTTICKNRIIPCYLILGQFPRPRSTLARTVSHHHPAR